MLGSRPYKCPDAPRP